MTGERLPSTTDAAARLEARVTPLVAEASAGVCLFDHRTGNGWGFNDTFRCNLASVVKVLTAVAAFRTSYRRGFPLTDAERGWITQALTVSDNQAQTDLWSLSGAHDGWDQTARAMGLSDQTASWPGFGWGRSWSTPRDQCTLIRQLMTGTGVLQDADRAFIMAQMHQVAEDQRWGVGAMGTIDGLELRIKDGWVALDDDGTWRVNSVGNVVGLGRDYSMAYLSTGWDSVDQGIDLANQVRAAVWSVLGEATIGPAAAHP